MKYITLEDNRMFENIKNSGHYEKMYIQFSANWCGPCKMITPKVKELVNNTQNDNAIYCYCDVDDYDELASKLNITSIPTFVIYNIVNGQFSEKLTSSNYEDVKNYFSL